MKRIILWLLIVLAAGASVLRAENGAVPSKPARTPQVYVIPIRGMIEPALLYVVRRGAEEAVREKADAVVFIMDTPGGTVNAARDIVFTIQSLPMPTVTLVEKNALSAGAIIALATRSIYMAPGSVIGDAMPIMMSPFGGVQEMPEGVEEKTVSAVAALIRAAAEQGGHDPALAEAMVRRENEFRIGDEIISPAGQLLTLTNEEAERPLWEDGRPLLSTGTVRDLDELLDRMGLPNAERRTLDVTGAERVARYVAALAPLFLMAGLLGIYIEIRTPGFGIPGILGLIALAIFFWGHHIAGLSGREDVLLFALGAALLAVELLFLPDFGLVGILGAILMFISLLLAMTQRIPGGPWVPSVDLLQGPLRNLAITVIGTMAAALAIGRFLPSSGIFRRLILEQATLRDEGFTASWSSSDLMGREGRALATLRPSGPAQFGDRRMDVIADGAYIEADTPVRIVDVHGNHVRVEPISDSRSKEPG